MTVGELKEILNNYNDYEEVKLDLTATEYGRAELLVGEYENIVLCVEN